MPDRDRPISSYTFVGCSAEVECSSLNLEIEGLNPVIGTRREKRHHDTKHNDIQCNDTKHSDIQCNYTKHNDIKHNDIQCYDTKHNDAKHNDIQCNDIQFYDT